MLKMTLFITGCSSSEAKKRFSYDPGHFNDITGRVKLRCGAPGDASVGNGHMYTNLIHQVAHA